jgi:hypothetical protein
MLEYGVSQRQQTRRFMADSMQIHFGLEPSADTGGQVPFPDGSL